MKTVINIIWVALLALGTASCQEPRSVKVTVVEEDGRTPVEDANVTVEFLGSTGEQDVDIKGKSDASGVFSAKGTAPLGMQVAVIKPGYYRTFVSLDKTKDHDVTLVLREKKNQVPMYAKRVVARLPGLGNGYGFDFKAGDWVAPHGKGKVSDVIFNMEKEVVDPDNYRAVLTVSFPNELDGLQEDTGWVANSEFRSSRQAPEASYSKEETVVNEKGAGGYADSPQKNLILRTRTKKSEDGKLLLACYAKITERLDMFVGTRFPNKPGSVAFTYYFNPTPNDRNLEFDPQRNLFKDLKPEEMVREP